MNAICSVLTTTVHNFIYFILLQDNLKSEFRHYRTVIIINVEQEKHYRVQIAVHALKHRNASHTVQGIIYGTL